MLAALLALALAETLSAIQVHGNTVTPDAEVVMLAGVEVGGAVDADVVNAVAERLRATKRFKSVQVLKRFASIADPSQIILVILVDEGPVTIRRTGDPARPVTIERAGRFNLLFLPILSAEDGYGLTYGARLAVPQAAGRTSRIGFPLTWGGEKRAAVELDKTFAAGPLDRVTAGAGLSRRTNPFYDEDDTRRRAWARAESQLLPRVRAGATVGYQSVTFPAGVDAAGRRVASGFGHVGADVTLDTRLDPGLPRNAVFVRGAWEHVAGANRTDLDARAYVGLAGQTVLAVRGQHSGSDRPLAPYLKPLLGGMANLRGFKAGTAAGDFLAAASAELIVPLSSPLSFGRLGVSAFVDAGTAHDYGRRPGDAEWKHGIGGSVWFSAAFLRLNVAIARGIGSSTRVHAGASVSF